MATAEPVREILIGKVGEGFRLGLLALIVDVRK